MEEAGCETKQIFYLQSSLGPFLVAYLFAGLLFQLHGQAQGLDDIWKEGVVVHCRSGGVTEAPFPQGRRPTLQSHPPCSAEKCLACWTRADSALFTKVSRS